MSVPDARSCPAVLASLRRTRYWLNVGVQVSASRSEVKSETVMVTANARKNVPVTPVMETRGRKTTMGVIVEPIRGTVISFSALWMASRRPWPASRCKTIFSRTTMASSMTNPTAAARPPKVMRLKDWPVSFRTIKVMSNVAGITRPATSDVPQSRRNRTRMMEESNNPSKTASRTLAMDSRTMVDWS